MPYCRNCGTAVSEADRFCGRCGAPAQAIQPMPVIIRQVVQPAPVVAQQEVCEKPKVPGRGFGISAMVLSIIGLAYAVLAVLTLLVESLAQTYLLAEDVVSMLLMMLTMFVMIAAMSVMALLFSLTARKRGYINRISASGLIMSVIGIVIWALQLGALVVGIFYYL